MHNVLFFGDIHADGFRLFDSRPGFRRTVLTDPKPAELDTVLPSVDAIVVRKLDLGAEILRKAGRLKIVSRHGVGVDNIDVEQLSRRGIPVMTVGDANAVSVAEHAMMLILSAARRLPSCMNLARTDTDAVSREEFLTARDAVGTMELAGRTVMIVGYGRIGRKVAKLADAFDMKVVVADPFVEPGVTTALGYAHVRNFEEALGRADCVVLCLPAPADAAPLFCAPQFARMKKGAVIVNVARGSLVDEDALADALQRGHLLAAGTDVWHRLPPGPDNRLLSQPNMVMTPHCAAHTEACLSRMAVRSVQNVLDYFDGALKRELCFNAEVLDRAEGSVPQPLARTR